MFTNAHQEVDEQMLRMKESSRSHRNGVGVETVVLSIRFSGSDLKENPNTQKVSECRTCQMTSWRSEARGNEFNISRSMLSSVRP